MRIANLPWYDFEELASATDALWAGFARAMEREGVDDVPAALDRKTPHAQQWRDPRLLLSQACGYDVLYDAAADLAVVAVPRFLSEGCEGNCYRSAIVVRETDRANDVREIGELRGRVCVVNEASSHSGTNSLRPLVAPLSLGGRFFREVVVSGDHVSSLELVASGRADVAAIDVVVLELCRRVRPQSLAGLRVIGLTEPAIAPPYVTSRSTPPELIAKLRRALVAAMADASLRPALDALRVGGIEFPDEAEYRSLARFEAPALANAYFELPAPRLSPLHRPPALHVVAGAAGPSAASARPRTGCAAR